MSATENGEPMAEALVEQPGGGVADGVTETEEQRLQEVERQRVEKEKRDEVIRRQSEELEESTRIMRAERSEANQRWLEEARAREAKRRANISAKGLTSGTPNAGRAAQRIRDAIEHGTDFLSTDQEVRIRKAAEEHRKPSSTRLTVGRNSCAKRIPQSR